MKSEKKSKIIQEVMDRKKEGNKNKMEKGDTARW